MDSIRRLITVLEQRGQQPHFLLNLDDTSSQESRLYYLVRDGVITSDQDAVQHLYGDHGGKAIPNNYRMLKSRVRKKLFNHLHLLRLQTDGVREVERIRMECRSVLYRAGVLFSLHEDFLVIELLEKVLPQLKKYEFYTMQLDALRTLETIYYHQKEKKKFQYYNDEIKELEAIVAADREAENIFRNIRIDANSLISRRQKVTQELKKGVLKIKAIWENTRTYRTFEYYYLLQVQHYELEGDFMSVIKLGDYAEQLVKSGNLNEELFDKSLNAYLVIYAHLREGLYDKGLKLAAQSLPLYDTNSGNWFAYMENYLVLALHKPDYELAYELAELVKSNTYFVNLPDAFKERWLVTNAFVNLVFNKSVPPELLERLKSADYISKDKLGFYVYVNVLEFMHLLLNHQTGEILEMYYDRYRKYMGTHLKSDKVERVRIFYKLMGLALREEFKYEACSWKGAALFDKMKSMKAPGEAYAEVEIVPYEHLWELALDMMKQRQQPPEV